MNQDTERSDRQTRVSNAIANCDRMLALLDEWEEADKKKSERSLFKRIFAFS